MKGCNKFLVKSLLLTGGSIVTVVATGLAFSAVPELISANYPIIYGAGVALYTGGTVGMRFTDFQVVSEVTRDEKDSSSVYLYSENELTRHAFFAANVLGMSILLAPFVSYAESLGYLTPVMISTDLSLAGTIMHVSTFTTMPYIYENKDMPAAFSGAKLATIGCGSVWLWNAQFGAQLLTMNASCLVSIPVFTMYLAWKLHDVISMYNSNKPDHLTAASFQLI